ncbi:MAG: hypothetical protein HUJ91_04695 [Bacteroidales bacterium]|nr:hypothetical protein [Bacteroidales bacterium]
MKKSLYLFLTLAVAALFFSCTKQDEVYQEWVKIGGYTYPQKPRNVTLETGWNRLRISWPRPTDQSVIRSKVYWDNYTDSIEFAYSDSKFEGLDYVFVEPEGLDETSHTFAIVNYDKAGNASIPFEISGQAYGDIYKDGLANKSIKSIEVGGILTLGSSTSELVKTLIRYQDRSGKLVVMEYPLDADNITLANAADFSTIEQCSAFLPQTGIDTVWTEWTLYSQWRVPTELSRKGWVAAANTSNEGFPPSNVLDGSHNRNPGNTAWFSQNSKIMRILTIDALEEHTFSGIGLWQGGAITEGGKTSLYYSMKNVRVYIGNEPFPIDSESDAQYRLDGYKGQVARYTFSDADKNQPVRNFSTPVKGRYIALVFEDTFNAMGWLRITEVIPYGW